MARIKQNRPDGAVLYIISVGIGDRGVLLLTGRNATAIINMMKKYDVAIIGAGAAGLSAAGAALRRGRSVVILDMGDRPARKVAASGGGRCNFTNMAAGRDRYFGKNPDFVRGALARVRPSDILDWAAGHGLGWVEKNPGQMFCKTGAADIVRALMRDANSAEILYNTPVKNVRREQSGFAVEHDDGIIFAERLIIATGGISFATLGVSDTGYTVAKQFGHKIIPPRPALCAIDTNAFPAEWAGVSIRAEIKIGGRKISGDMLFTHFGIGGPAVYSASLAGTDNDIIINLMPDIDVLDWLRDQKHKNGKKSIHTLLGMHLPTQIARHFGTTNGNIADTRDTTLAQIAGQITNFKIPARTWRHHGMAAAEVTFGGVDTGDISSKTMESKLCPGLFFAGEVMDITGDLGGFNLQWAWASGRVAGGNA